MQLRVTLREIYIFSISGVDARDLLVLLIFTLHSINIPLTKRLGVGLVTDARKAKRD